MTFWHCFILLFLSLNYLAGEESINQQLSQYLHAEEQLNRSPASLDRAIGDLFFEIGEYPWAILYYTRALQKDSGNRMIESQIGKAYEQLGLLPSPPSPSPILRQMLLEPYLTLPQRFELFFWSVCLTTLVWSLAIWFPAHQIRNVAIFAACLTVLLFGNVIFSYYFIPLEGIMVSSTGFYRDPGENQPQVSNAPLMAGSKVKVLQASPKGDWLKVNDTSGLVGYVPAASIRII